MFILGSVTAIAVAFGTLAVTQQDLFTGLQAQQCAVLFISLLATAGFSFVGFVDDSEHPLAIAVLLEKGGSGGTVAAPIAQRILARAIKLGY